MSNIMINQPAPLVSVIIPTYNRAHVIGRAIQSVLSQTYQNFELLIVDDGSNDDTADAVHGFDDPRIVLYKHERNHGQNAALNTGLKISKGEYIAFLDSDDEWLPLMLEKQIGLFQKDDTLGVVYTWAGTYQADGVLKPLVKFSLSGYIYKQALTQAYVSHMITMMVKKSCFDNIGWFDVEFDNCQDDDICLRLAKEYRFGLIPEILAIVHNDGSSQITKNSKSFAKGWLKLFSKHESEIRRVCGDKVMARHWAKCGKLFLGLREKNMVCQLFEMAYQLDHCFRYKINLIFVKYFQCLWFLLKDIQMLTYRKM